MERYKKHLIIPLSLVGLLSLLRTIYLLWDSHFLDFTQFYKSAIFLFNGYNPYIISENAMTANYPPLFYLFMYPFTLFEISTAGNIFLIASVISASISIILLKKIFEFNYNETSVIAILFFISFPFKFNLGMGQINIIVLMIMSIFMYLYPRTLSLYALTLSILLKIFPVILILVPLHQKRWKYLYKECVLFCVLVGISIAVFGLDIHISFIYDSLLPIVIMEEYGNGYYNQAITASLSRVYVPSVVINSMQILIFLVSLYVLYINKKNSYYLIALLVTLFLLVSSITWQHYLVFLVIPFLYLYKNIKKQGLRILLYIAYFLIAFNITNPDDFSSTIAGNVLLNHGFIGVSVLFFLMMHNGYIHKKTK